MAENKTKPTKLSVTAFIESVKDQSRRGDAKELVKLMQSASGEKPQMWGPAIIGFGSTHYSIERGKRRYAGYRIFATQGGNGFVWADWIQ